jgi:hypothetical protein
VSKRCGSLYRGGESRDWLKTKCHETGIVAITGFSELGEGRLEAVYVAEERGGALRPAGQVRFGFAGKRLWHVLDRLRNLVGKLDLLEIKCHRCDRHGRVSLARLGAHDACTLRAAIAPRRRPGGWTRNPKPDHRPLEVGTALLAPLRTLRGTNQRLNRGERERSQLRQAPQVRRSAADERGVNFCGPCLIPSPINQNRCAQSRNPIDIMVQG